MIAAASTPLPDMTQVLADAEHGLAGLEPVLPLNFRFRWRDLAFRARVAERTESTVALQLSGDLGPMPYSAESIEKRRRLLSLAHFAGAEGFRFGVSGRQHLVLVGETAMPRLVTGAAVVSAVALLLLRSEPYLDLARQELTAAATH